MDVNEKAVCSLSLTVRGASIKTSAHGITFPAEFYQQSYTEQKQKSFLTTCFDHLQTFVSKIGSSYKLII